MCAGGRLSAFGTWGGGGLVVSFDFIRYFMISCLFKCLVAKHLQLTIHIVCTIFVCEILVFSLLAVSNVNISKSIFFLNNNKNMIFYFVWKMYACAYYFFHNNFDFQLFLANNVEQN